MHIWAIAVFILAQFVPTFGGQLGSSGNGIVLGTAFVGYFLAVLGFLYNRGINRRVFIRIMIYMFITAFLISLSTLLTPFDIVLRDLSIFVKIGASFFAVLAGYCFFRDERQFKTLLGAVLIIFAFHFILYLDSLHDANSSLQVLYHYKSLFGGYRANRFPGTWNFPYNETVFLIGCALIFLFKFTRKETKGLEKGLLLLCIALAVYMSLLGTQARSGFIAFFIVCAYFTILLFLMSLTKDSAKYMGAFLGMLIVFITIFVQIWSFLEYAKTQNEFRHLSKLLNPDTAVSMDRIHELQMLVNTHLASAPWRILIGFGGARGDEHIYLESVLNYVFNYGLIGFTLILGPWLYMWFKSLMIGINHSDRRVSMGAIITHIFLTYAFLMGMSTDIFIHFRFIPMFYFFFGVALKYFEIVESKKSFLRYNVPSNRPNDPFARI